MKKEYRLIGCDRKGYAIWMEEVTRCAFCTAHKGERHDRDCIFDGIV